MTRSWPPGRSRSRTPGRSRCGARRGWTSSGWPRSSWPRATPSAGGSCWRCCVPGWWRSRRASSSPLARERGASPRTAAILALAAFALAAPALALRPQLFGIALFAVLLWLIAVRARSPRLYLLAPVVVALWANLHGSFVLGPALLGYAWLSDIAAKRPGRMSLWILVLGSLATLANPYLAGAWLYAANIGVNPAIAAQVSEWQRTPPLRHAGAALLSVRRDHGGADAPPTGPGRVAGLGAGRRDGPHGCVGRSRRRVVGAGDGLRTRGRARDRAPSARRRAPAP